LEWQLKAWRAVTRKGRPKGAAEAVPAILLPVAGDGPPRSWKVVFVPPISAAHVYLQLDAFWADEEGCGGNPDLGSQEGTWTYHLRLQS
jgi:hypothetical protein